MTAARHGRRPAGYLWLTLAVVLSLSVLAINRVPLYYFDSAGYKVQGDSILHAILPGWKGQAAAPAAEEGTAATPSLAEEEGAPGAGDEKDGEVNVSRSPTYAVIVAAAWSRGAPYLVPVLQLVSVLVAAALTARAMSRATHRTVPRLTLIAAPVAASALTALPFYIAYIMPDIYAALAILMMALVVAYSRHMKAWELLVALALLAFSVMVHRSHLMLVGLAVPFAAFVVLMTARRHFWIVAGLIAAAAAVGFLEIGAYSVAAEKVSGKEASFRPFITARLISDGPGYDYLLENCPDDDIPTCPLAPMLTRSDDPARLHPTRIVFDRSEELGTFRLLSPEAQHQVAADQIPFFFRVLADKPVGVIGALLQNTLEQTWLVDITMTIPDAASIKSLKQLLKVSELDVGMLAEKPEWIAATNQVHMALYGVSLGAILVICLWPGLATREMRVFVGFVFLCILINAFVCGAVSQPASRYGARVAWLLPYMGVLLAMVSYRARASDRQGVAALGGRKPAE